MTTQEVIDLANVNTLHIKYEKVYADNGNNIYAYLRVYDPNDGTTELAAVRLVTPNGADVVHTISLDVSTINRGYVSVYGGMNGSYSIDTSTTIYEVWGE